MAEHLLARGTVAEHHREAATAGKEGRATAGKEMRTTAGKERKGVRLPARRDCSGATGWSLFLIRPLCKLFLYL